MQYCTITMTEFNVEVWQKFQKLSPPKASGLSSVHSVQVPKCWVKDGWPVNKGTGKKIRGSRDPYSSAAKCKEPVYTK